MDFNSKLKDAIARNKSRVCVGLDIDPEKLPAHISKTPGGVLSFSASIIDATRDLVCAYKPNLAFFEAFGDEGFIILKKILKNIPDHLPVIIDAKRGDIGNTAAKYAKAIFEDMGADATTLSPYMGYDSISPFLEYHDKTSFLLCLTSNKGSSDFQKLRIEGGFLYEHVAQKAGQWNEHKNIGLVVGATNPNELTSIRSIAPDMPFLIPGVGAQGGSVKECVDHALTDNGEIIINSSRAVLYASSDKDFADAARIATQQLSYEINNYI